MSLAGEGPGGTLLCATSAERETSAPSGPLRPFPTPSVAFSVAGTPAVFPPPRRSGGALPPGRARLCLHRETGTPRIDPHPRGTRCRVQERLPGKAQGLGVPGLLAQPPRIIRAACEPGCALGRVCSLSAFFPPFYSFSGNDNYLNLDYGSAPCYR